MPPSATFHLSLPNSRYASGTQLDVEFSDLGVVARTCSLSMSTRRAEYHRDTRRWIGDALEDGPALRELWEEEGVAGARAIEGRFVEIWNKWRMSDSPSRDADAEAAFASIETWIRGGAKPVLARG